MTVKDANELIGKLVDRPYGDCVFQTRIIDVKTAFESDWTYGSHRLCQIHRVLLEPVAGRGSTWVNLDGLRIDEEEFR
jgi:hypothetical protein